jgi:hypothetical protein
LYGLWFVDDSILLFRNLAQAARLMPDVIALLRHLGLAINVSKSCVLGSGLPLVLPGCLEPFPVCHQSVYLGLPLQLVEDDELLRLLEHDVQFFEDELDDSIEELVF